MGSTPTGVTTSLLVYNHLMILNTKIGKIETSKDNASLNEIQQALNKLYLSKDIEHSQVSLININDLTLEIYFNTVVLQTYLCYDGPGGPGEKFIGRINVKYIFDNAEKITSLLENCCEDELIQLLKSLPKVN